MTSPRIEPGFLDDPLNDAATLLEVAATRLRSDTADSALRPDVLRHGLAILADIGLFRLAHAGAADGRAMARLIATLETLGHGTDELGVLFAGGVQAVAGVVPVVRYATAHERERWLPGLLDASTVVAFAASEPSGGSDPLALNTRAERVTAGWRLNGRKAYITNVADAGVILCLARTAEGRAWNALSAFLLPADAEGVVVAEPHVPAAFRPASFGEVHLDDVVVAETALLGELGGGLQIFSDVMAMERVALCAPYVGHMRRQVQAVLDHVRSRVSGGRPLLQHANVRQRLARMHVRTTTAKLHLDRAAAVLTEGGSAMSESATAKMAIVDAFLQNSLCAGELIGAAGFAEDHPAIRALLHAAGARLHSGTEDMMLETIASELRL